MGRLLGPKVRNNIKGALNPNFLNLTIEKHPSPLRKRSHHSALKIKVYSWISDKIRL